MQALANVQGGFSLDQVELIKRTIAKGASDDELSLFINVCNKTGLDPFMKQIYAVFRWDSKLGRNVMSIQVSIDGLRLQAARSGEIDGQDGPYWCAEDGIWKEVWLSDKPPAAAKVLVYRRGCSHPFVGIARFDAYKQTQKDGKLTTFWARMPDLMIAKVAESLALRKAFPAELSGLYSGEEMGEEPVVEAIQAPKTQPQTQQAIAHTPQQPVPSERVEDAEYSPVSVPVGTTNNTPQPTARTPVIVLPADSMKMLLKQFQRLERSWYAAKTKEWVSKVLGRAIPSDMQLGELTEEEANTLYSALEEIAAKKKTKAGAV
jgi:phage recombination protein Bet